MKLTGLKLFRNHITIEPVIEVFGDYNHQVVGRLRDVFLEEFAASDNYGMIFTYMWAFDQQEGWDYIEHVKQIFAPCGTEFYYVELVAPQAVRLERNITENRLRHKVSKRDVAVSARRITDADEKYRCESFEGEIPFANYLRIDSTDLTAAEAAQKIRDHFSL